MKFNFHLQLVLLAVPLAARAGESPDPEADADAGVLDGGKAEDIEYSTLVLGQRPLSRDKTEDRAEVGGARLRDSSRTSMLEALSGETGSMYVTGRGGFHGVASGATGGICVRGLGGSPNSQVLVVEDGVPDYQGIFGHPIPDAYVSFLVDEVLIVKGGDSVLFGSNAMGAVIVIRNRWLAAEGFEILNDASYGAYSTMHESISMLARSGRADFAASFFTMSTEGHRDGAGGDEIVGHTAYRYRFAPNLSLSLRNKVVHLKGGDPGPVTHPWADHWFDVWRDNASVELAWDKRPVRLKIAPYFNFGVHELYDGFRSVDHTAGANAELEFELHRTAELIVGLSGNHVGGEVENRITGERPDVNSLKDLSFYNQLAFRPVAPLSFVAGTRELYSFERGFVFLYKGGARLDILDGVFARTRAARNFRQPTIRELYLPYPTANPELKPEYSFNWDFSLGYDSDFLEISCTGYRTAANDMIKYFGSWPAAEVVNIDYLEIWGVESSLGVKQVGPLSFFVTGDWRDVGRYTRQNPSAKMDFKMEAGRNFGPHFAAASLTGEWVHGLYMSNYGRDPIDDVFTMDLTVRYRRSLPSRRVTLEPYVFLRNILNRTYAYVEDYPMPGFNAAVGLKIGI